MLFKNEVGCIVYLLFTVKTLVDFETFKSKNIFSTMIIFILPFWFIINRAPQTEQIRDKSVQDCVFSTTFDIVVMSLLAFTVCC